MNSIKHFMKQLACGNKHNQKKLNYLCFIANSVEGYTTLISVIISGAIGTSIALSLLTISLNSIQTNFTNNRSIRARTVAEACAEIALLKIQSDTNYVGGDNITIDDAAGSYAVSNLGGQNKEIQALASIGSITSKLKIEINQVTPNIIISSWQEVADF